MYSYTLQTVQISNIPTTANVYLNWFLTSGTNLPRVFYAKNYPGITTTGSTTINLVSDTPDAFTPPFTEIVTPGNGTLINVANTDFLTFATLKIGPIINLSSDDANFEIYSYVSPTNSQLIASGEIKVVDR